MPRIQVWLNKGKEVFQSGEVKKVERRKFMQVESGVALIELVIILPFLLVLTASTVTLGALMQQMFWFEQTSYNSVLYSSSLSTLTAYSDRLNKTKQKAEALSGYHRDEQKNKLINFDSDSGIAAQPFDSAQAAADPTDPTKRFLSVSMVGDVQKMFLFTIPIKSSISASSLLPIPIAANGARFCGSNRKSADCYGTPDCCGDYGGSAPGSCVSGTVYQCSDSSKIGYVTNAP